MSRRDRLTPWILALDLALAPLAAAQQDDAQQEDLDLEELLEVEIEVATGFPQPLSLAPAVASVITAADIEEMGATHLDEVLETVPGLHVGLAKGRGLDPVYAIRGIQSSLSSQVLILVNGVPITQLQNGGAILGFQLPVASIARVEVIRGPGSAIYGADAFAGVINVITKTAADVSGSEVGLAAGSFDNANVWFTYGGLKKGWDVFFSADWRRTDGDHGRVVERDQQSALDEVLGTDASLAPGPLATFYEMLDVHFGLARGPWTLHLWGWDKDRGLGAGVAQILDPAGENDSSQLLADLVYRRDDLAESWVFTERWSYLAIDQKNDFRIFPPGAVVPIAADGSVSFEPGVPANLVLFPDGVIGRPGEKENHLSFDSVAAFDGYADHRWRLNAGLVLQDISTDEQKNFGPGVIDGTQLVVDGTLTDVTGTDFVFLEDNERDHYYFSLQDEWSISGAWQLTAGVRYDRFSDFGGTFNPRAALVWSGRHDLTAKLLYGSAFRAPSFGQLFAINNPAGLGNPKLDPEEIDTLELVFDYHPVLGLRTAVNLFTYRIDGLIDLVPDPDATSATAQNVNDQRGHGFELELEWERGDTFRLDSNFAWQRSEDEVTGARIAEVAGRQLYFGAFWRPRRGVHLFAQAHWIADRHRAPDDLRPPLDDYLLVNLGIRRGRVGRRWDFSFIARNVFDEIGREPSDSGIPDDFPLAGRAVFAEIRFHVR